MKLKLSKCYKHEKGAVGMIVGKMNSVVAGKCFVMEMYVPGLKPTLQPVSMEKDLPEWHRITLKDFIGAINRLNKGRIDDKITEIKADTCMRQVSAREKNDLHLVIRLTCGHLINFDLNDEPPAKDATFHCKECENQNQAVLTQIEASVKG